MDSKQLEELRHKTLSMFEKDFTDNRIPAILAEKDENGVEVLSMILGNAAKKGKDAICEFFFLPTGEDDDVQLFVNLITIAEELSEEYMGELCTAVSAINAYVLTGAFAIDYASKSLVYKYTYEISTDAAADKVADCVDLSMGMAFKAVDTYGHLLLEVNDGEKSAKDVLTIFTDHILGA